MEEPSGSNGRASQPGALKSLHQAAKAGDGRAVVSFHFIPLHGKAIKKLLLSYFPQTFKTSQMHKPREEDEAGLTPLHLAVAFGHKEVVQFLVSQGANCVIPDNEDMYPVSLCKDAAMFDALLCNYTSYLASFNENRATQGVLFHADAKSGNLKVLQALKAFKPDDIDMARLLTNGERDCINSPETDLLSLSQWDDEYNRTCLHWAVVDKRIDIVQKLCKDVKLWPGIQDRDGKTALQHAFEQKNHMMLEILSFKRVFKEHEEKLYRDREVYVQALNSILVGAALIASVTFAGWLQTPFESEFKSLALKIYWASNSASFFTSVATMCVTTTALLPTPSRYVGDIVNQLRLAIVIDAGLLALSLAAVMWAFAAAGFAALRHANIFAYQVIMRSSTILGGFLCLIVWLAFVLQLFKCIPPKSVLFALVLPSLPFGLLRTRWLPACLQNVYAHVGDSSRFGYPSAKRSELKAIMDKDLVVHRANQLNPKTHALPASSTISLATMERVLIKLDIADKDRFLEKICKQREAEIAYKQKSGGAIKHTASRFGLHSPGVAQQGSTKFSPWIDRQSSSQRGQHRSLAWSNVHPSGKGLLSAE
ncbi:hypothetical protein GOP47_0003939 [Adiantum capillus-veneris]|uniref:PGG domain-containing protein n=1 Tax=Adiantum capillus-veneris TaxID=13818 RepID=A0A9D4ZP94_ADICA|nr:hypothetical protein GOP47_0003939 [Adiantum capillus-veneris]